MQDVEPPSASSPRRLALISAALFVGVGAGVLLVELQDLSIDTIPGVIVMALAGIASGLLMLFEYVCRRLLGPASAARLVLLVGIAAVGTWVGASLENETLTEMTGAGAAFLMASGLLLYVVGLGLASGAQAVAYAARRRFPARSTQLS